MTDPLDAQTLAKHVETLSRRIGPRPTGHPAEAVAQEYVRDTLRELGYSEIEEMPFPAWDTWGYPAGAPGALSLAGSTLGKLGRIGRGLSGLLSVFAAANLLAVSQCARQPLAALYPKRPTKNLLLRIPAAGRRRHRVALVGHTDTNKHRRTFAPETKRYLRVLETLNIFFPLLHGAAQLGDAISDEERFKWLRRLSGIGMLVALGVLVADELEGYVEGANDNATAVAALLGIAAHLKDNPLTHTEVWLVFTSAEEVGCEGMHHLLDEYGHVLNNAYFIDLEMVGCREIAYVTEHSSFSYLTSYEPDPESLLLAEKTARRRPDLGVSGREMVIGEEVGALRSRDYRGVCLVGVGEDGWLANWHQYSDTFEHIAPEGVEKAARFALAMMEELDRQH